MKHYDYFFSVRCALIFAIIASVVSSVFAQDDRAKPPNIILIFADDLGWKDVGYQGTDFYETPNIDRLAKNGMVFTNAYAAGANCQPSRACLLSGLYTPRHGVYAVESTDRGDKKLMRMQPVPNTPYLESRFVSVAEALKQAGYATGHFGKWHLSHSKEPGSTPKGQGFDITFDKNPTGQGVREDPKSVFSITKAACDFMEKNRDKPFFAYVAHHAIHAPFQTTQESLDKFSAKKPGQQHRDPYYAGTVRDLDTVVQTLLDKVEELHLSDRTVIIFTSDNGGIPKSSQEPLRGSKGCYYEGGIREPFIVLYPGVTKPGSVCDVPITLVDLYPMFLDIARANVPEGVTLDGESIVPLLRGDNKLRRECLFWHFPGYLDEPVRRGRDPVFRTRPVSVVRKGDWKLHLYHEEWLLDGGRAKLDTNNAVELYNIKEDIGERKDLALANKAKRNELLDDLLEWCKKTNAKMPTPLP